MSDLRKLEMQGCRTFVCPNLSIIEEKGKELNLREDTIKRSKDMATEFFKKTYHKPHYSSARHVVPGIVYAACVLEYDKRLREDIAETFGVSGCTVTKWYRDVIRTLDIEVHKKGKTVKERKFRGPKIDLNRVFYEIDKQGKALSLKYNTIERAKNIAIKYFKIESYGHHYHIIQLCSAFIYTASITENDKRTQIDISQVSGISETMISKWYIDILRVLGMKIISNNKRTILVLEGQYDD